jgi:hypothetical protein
MIGTTVIVLRRRAVGVALAGPSRDSWIIDDGGIRRRHLSVQRCRSTLETAQGGVELTALVYELLDAHADTAQLASGYERDESWAAHLEYLRSLQRLGRRVLAGIAAEQLV